MIKFELLVDAKVMVFLILFIIGITKFIFNYISLTIEVIDLRKRLARENKQNEGIKNYETVKNLFVVYYRYYVIKFLFSIWSGGERAKKYVIFITNNLLNYRWRY